MFDVAGGADELGDFGFASVMRRFEAVMPLRLSLASRNELIALPRQMEPARPAGMS